MPQFEPLQLAVLIDADNVSAKALSRVLVTIARLGHVQCCEIYGNVSRKARRNWTAVTDGGGFPLPRFVYGCGNNAADFQLTIGAAVLARTAGIGGVCLLSSDGHFAHVVRWLRAQGVKVHVFGAPTAARSLRKAADCFHSFGVAPGAGGAAS